MAEPESWHVSWPVEIEGQSVHHSWKAKGESNARALARSASQSHGSATITNRAGLFAMYINGVEWKGEKT